MIGADTQARAPDLIEHRNQVLRADWAWKYHQRKVMPDLRTPEMAIYYQQVVCAQRERARQWLQSLPHRHTARDFWVDRAYLRLAKAKAAKAHKVLQFKKAEPECRVLPFYLTK